MKKPELEKYKEAIEAFSIIAITDVRGNITYANDNFCELSQFSPKELLGQNHRIINSGYHPKSFFKEMWKTIANGKSWRGEIKNQAKDGSFYWVDTVIVPMLDQAGKPYEYFSIRIDITERKKQESRLIRYNQLLNQQNEKLKDIKFINSHKLRLPIANILGLSEILEDNEIQADVLKQTINGITESAKLLDNFINELNDTITAPAKMEVTMENKKEKSLILLIDDDRINNLINKRLIGKRLENVEVKDFTNPMEALAFLKENPNSAPDLILLDINMPEISGWDFLKHYRELQLQVGKLYILTSSIDPDDLNKARTFEEVTDLITKPLNSETLARILA